MAKQDKCCPCPYNTVTKGQCPNHAAWYILEVETGKQRVACRDHIGWQMEVQYTYEVEARP